MIRDFRISQGMTQAEAAAVIGCSRTTLSKWENGVGSPSIAQLEKLAIHCGVPIETMFWVAKSKKQRVKKSRPRLEIDQDNM